MCAPMTPVADFQPRLQRGLVALASTSEPNWGQIASRFLRHHRHIGHRGHWRELLTRNLLRTWVRIAGSMVIPCASAAPLLLVQPPLWWRPARPVYTPGWAASRVLDQGDNVPIPPFGARGEPSASVLDTSRTAARWPLYIPEHDSDAHSYFLRPPASSGYAADRPCRSPVSSTFHRFEW